MKKHGFTLIELIVVVAIIGILATVIAVNLNGARAKSRDAQRMSNVKQLSLALDLYYNDKNHYPATVEGIPGCAHQWMGYPNDVPWANLGTVLSPYVSALSKDPGDGSKGMRYCSGDYAGIGGGGSSRYELASSLETAIGNGAAVLGGKATDINNSPNLCFAAGGLDYCQVSTK